MSELHEEIRRAYLAGLEDAAQMAEEHKGSARAERVARNRTPQQACFYSQTEITEILAEILAEERGEDIASDIIAKAIREKIAAFPDADEVKDNPHGPDFLAFP